MFKLNNFTTKNILIFTFIIVTVIPILAATLLYYKNEQKSLIDNTTQYEQQMVERVANDFRKLYSQIDSVKYEMASQINDLDIMHINYYKYTTVDLSNIRLLESFMQSTRRTVSGVSDIYIIRKDNQQTAYASIISFDQEKLLKESWVQRIYNRSVNWVLIPPHKADYYRGASSSSDNLQNGVVSFVTGIVDINTDNDFDFILQIDINSSFLEGLSEDMVSDYKDVILVKDNGGNIITEFNYSENPDRNDLESMMKSHRSDGLYTVKNRLLVVKNLPDLGLVIYKTKEIEMGSNEKELLKNILLIVFISIILASILAVCLSSSITKPLSKLVDNINTNINDMLTNDNGLVTVRLSTGNYDIRSLSKSFNIMIDRINKLIQNIIREEAEKKDIEMKMLQAQISPHFLYNTLNSIKWMALMEHQNKIADAIVSLVDLLEFCCKDHNSLVTVDKELDFLNKYIDLQKLRYNYAVKVIFNIDEDIRQLYILKFTLQPYIENTLIHAFDTKTANPYIAVSGHICEGRLVIEVEDNGSGFDLNSVKHMTGIGIRNVDERIKLVFGSAFGQNIESVIDKGTHITLTLPVIKDWGKENNVQVAVGR